MQLYDLSAEQNRAFEIVRASASYIRHNRWHWGKSLGLLTAYPPGAGRLIESRHFSKSCPRLHSKIFRAARRLFMNLYR